MSRRETIINVLLGSFLVLSLAVPLLALWIVVRLLGLVLAHFLPGVSSHQEIILAAMVAAALLLEMIRALRQSRWRSAFLNFALASALVIISASDLRFGNSPDTYWFVLAMLCFGTLRWGSLQREDIGLLRFSLGAALVSVLFAAETGLFGTGLLSHVLRGSIYVGFLVWFAIRIRKGWPEDNNASEITSASAAG